MRSSEAAAIADVLFQAVEGRTLTSDARHRLAGRLKNLETPTIRVYPLSLEQDPIHPSSYYLAVDGLNHGAVTPLLLRLGLASSPASGLFPKSVLIGRMRPAGGREVVVNAIPFGPGDAGQVRTFTEQVAKGFLPRPQGSQPALIVTTTDAPAAFEAFRQVLRDTGQNRAAFAVERTEDATAVIWAAVRAGWREGYSLGLTGIRSTEGLEQAGIFSRYSVQAEATAVYDELRRLKPRGFDFELDLRGVDLREAGVTAESLAETLQAWRAAGRQVNSVVPPEGSDSEAWSAVARQYNALLTLEGPVSLKAYGRGHRWLREPSGETLVELGRD